MNKYLRDYLQASAIHLRLDGQFSIKLKELCKDDSFYIIVEEVSDKGKHHTHGLIVVPDYEENSFREWVKENFEVSGTQFSHSQVRDMCAAIRYLCKDNDIGDIHHKGISILDLNKFKLWSYGKYSKAKFAKKLDELEFEYYMNDLRFEQFATKYFNLKLLYNQSLGTGAENYLMHHYYKKNGVNQWLVNFSEKKNLY